MNKFLQIVIVTSWGLLLNIPAIAAPHFVSTTPLNDNHYEINGSDLCATAKETLAYLKKGPQYDPQVIHPGKICPISLLQIKATLEFICKHQTELNNPAFVKKHFQFIHWSPDNEHAKRFSANKPLLQHLPQDHILMTKYYVHVGKASMHASKERPYAIYALPLDEQSLTLDEANTKSNLIRFNYGKQAILAGALDKKRVPILAYVSRDDLEAALMQGTIIADFGGTIGQKTLNVHRNNNIEYNRLKPPYEQERYWYFKQVDGIKGYGKDSDHKITVNTGVTFAGDLSQFGLGKVLMVQYPDKNGSMITRAGILADTGGAFTDNLYQVDFLLGTYQSKEAYNQAAHDLPDYIDAYFMVLKSP